MGQKHFQTIESILKLVKRNRKESRERDFQTIESILKQLDLEKVEVVELEFPDY